MQRADTVVSLKKALNINLVSFYCIATLRLVNSGESAFCAMMQGFGWAKNPIVKRMNKLSNDIPITLLYGSRSWVDNTTGETIKEARPSSYVNVQVRESCGYRIKRIYDSKLKRKLNYYISQVITGAGHHVYADKCETFNKYVSETCALNDSTPQLTSSDSRSYPKVMSDQEISVTLNKALEGRSSEEQGLETSRPRSS